MTQHVEITYIDVPESEIDARVAGFSSSRVVSIKVVRQENGLWQITATLPGDSDVPTE